MSVSLSDLRLTLNSPIYIDVNVKNPLLYTHYFHFQFKYSAFFCLNL